MNLKNVAPVNANHLKSSRRRPHQSNPPHENISRLVSKVCACILFKVYLIYWRALDTYLRKLLSFSTGYKKASVRPIYFSDNLFGVIHIKARFNPPGFFRLSRMRCDPNLELNVSLHIKFYQNGDPIIADKILRSLPGWFGIEKAILDYIKESKELPMIVAFRDNTPIGFISLKNHSTYTAEIYVMGVIPEHHRHGVGRALVIEAQNFLKRSHIEFLQVKTLDESRECDFYKKTRLFYKSLGFKEVEVFPTLWGKDNPCLLMIKKVTDSEAS